MTHTSDHGDTAKHSEHTAQEAVSEEVMLPLTMPIFPPGMFCFSQSVGNTHVVVLSTGYDPYFTPDNSIIHHLKSWLTND